mmetsp:Transcript_67472/g.150605  ORF Transcript_67472/g.150605 Transcript_67472/m.150605 type:complete len:207 (+) Transcript_67472:1796-2416(+)
MPLEATLLGTGAHQFSILVVHIEQILHVRHQIGLRIVALPLHQSQSNIGDVLAHNISNWLQPSRDAREEAEHARQILGLVIAKERLTTRVLFLEEQLLRRLQKLLVAHFEQLLLSRRVQIVHHPLLLLPKPVLCLAHVVWEGILLRPLAALPAVEFCRRCQHHLLEVAHINLQVATRAAHLHKNLHHILDQLPVDDLAFTLAADQL